jgi:hypothetical protein
LYLREGENEHIHTQKKRESIIDKCKGVSEGEGENTHWHTKKQRKSIYWMGKGTGEGEGKDAYIQNKENSLSVGLTRAEGQRGLSPHPPNKLSVPLPKESSLGRISFQAP